MASEGIIFIPSPVGFIELAHEEFIKHALESAAENVVQAARDEAPKLTGAGAASIHEEAEFDGHEWKMKVSWDAAHDYMRYQDQGTQYVEPVHFLEDAIQEARLM